MPGPDPEVLVVDDQLGVRRGTELLLREFGFRVAGVATTMAEAGALLRRRRYDVALVETTLDDAPTAPLLREVLTERPDAPIIVYAGRDRGALADAASVGAPGLVLKSSAAGTLLGALGAVGAGETFVDPAAPARLPAPRVRQTRRGVALLSARERQVLLLLADGLSGADIAAELFLSAETVRTHVRNAVQKLGCRTRTQAVALVIAEGDHEPAVARAAP